MQGLGNVSPPETSTTDSEQGDFKHPGLQEASNENQEASIDANELKKEENERRIKEREEKEERIYFLLVDHVKNERTKSGNTGELSDDEDEVLKEFANQSAYDVHKIDYKKLCDTFTEDIFPKKPLEGDYLPCVNNENIFVAIELFNENMNLVEQDFPQNDIWYKESFETYRKLADAVEEFEENSIIRKIIEELLSDKTKKLIEIATLDGNPLGEQNTDNKETNAAKSLFSQNVENLELIRNCLVKETQDKRYLVFNCLEKAHRELDALNRGTNNKKDPADCEFINQLVLSHNGIYLLHIKMQMSCKSISNML